MTYLVAYRSGSQQYANAAQEAFKSVPAYKPPTSPAANDNMPRPANDNVRNAKALLSLTSKGRAVLRANPWINAATTAWDLYRMLKPDQMVAQQELIDLAAGGWTLLNTCAGVGGPTHYLLYVSFEAPTPPPSFSCTTGQAVGVDPIGQAFWNPHLNGLVLWRQTQAPPNDRYSAVAEWWHPFGSLAQTAPIAVTAPRVVTLPAPRPIYDPFTLPILFPMPLPVPLPTAVIPHLRNDPLGSTRTNGDVRPRFIPRTPPPKRTKEKKLRSPLGVAQALAAAATEGIDFIDAFHNALPKELQAKAVFKGGKWWNPSPQSKLEAIWDGLDSMDWNEAVKNVIINQITDAVLGRANAGADQALNQAPGGRIVRGIAF